MRLTHQGAVLGILFVLLSTARAWAEFDPASPARWLFVAFFPTLLRLFTRILAARARG